MKAIIVLLCTMSLSVSAAVAQSGSWEITDKTDALDGARSYIAGIYSDDEIANIIGRQEKALLTFSCDKRGFFATIGWPDFVQDDFVNSDAPVRWKLDDGQPQTSTWFATTKVVGQLGNKGLATLRGWSGGHKLIVQVPDHHGGQDVTFSLDGIADVYQTLSQRSCGSQ